METFKNFVAVQVTILFILPMRNGNKPSVMLKILLASSFYPTYEEWKQIRFHRMSLLRCLFILPMRNGNPETFEYIIEKFEDFLSYL